MPAEPRRCLPAVTAQYEALSQVYDELLGDQFFSDQRRIFEQIERRYALLFSSAVDVGCGTGTFVSYLRARGVAPVWGVDRSRAMLARAVAKNAGNGARFLQQDLRELRLPEPVDLLVCQFDTLNYLLTLSDLHTAFAAFGRALHPGGHAVFDVVTPHTFEPGRTHRLEQADGLRSRVTRTTSYLPRGLQTARVRVSDASGDRCEEHLQRAYAPAEIAGALDGSGLVLSAVHDFHRLSAPPDLAERVIVVAGVAPPGSPARR